ncbi:hypothetical protein HN51_034224 [Arachis hypogaea]
MSNDFHANSNDNSLQQAPNNSLQLVYHGGWCTRGHKFWHARRAFLNSYNLSLEPNNDNNNNKNGGIKEKLKKSMKEAHEATIGVVFGIFKRRRVVGVRAYRVTMNFPSSFLVIMRCFIPWLHKKGNYVTKY